MTDLASERGWPGGVRAWLNRRHQDARRTLNSNAFVFVVAPLLAALLGLVAVHVTGVHLHGIGPSIIFEFVCIVLGLILAEFARSRSIGAMLKDVREISNVTQPPNREFLLNLATERLRDIVRMVQDLSRGEYEPPGGPSAMKEWFSSFFASGGNAYTGVDSHVPSDYLKTYGWYLDVQREALGANSRAEHLRYVISSVNELSEDYGDNPEAWVRFLEWHRKTGVRVRWVDRFRAEQLKAFYHLPEVDVALWARYSVLFRPIGDGNVALSMRFVGDRTQGDPSYEQIARYVAALAAEARDLEEGPPGLELVDADTATAWVEYVSPGTRLSGADGSLGAFLLQRLADRQFVLDAAAGLGYETLFLMHHDYTVRCNEVDARFAAHARQIAEQRRCRLDLTTLLWQDLPRKLPGNAQFEAVLVLGNSVCLVRQPDLRQACLKAFFDLLVPGGMLIIDERNFSFMLDNAEAILSSPSDNWPYYSRGDVMYPGDAVRGMPTKINEDEVRWRLFRPALTRLAGADKEVHYLSDNEMVLYPFKHGELYRSLTTAGFGNIEVFADFRRVGDKGMPSRDDLGSCAFITYVAYRPESKRAKEKEQFKP